MTTNGTAGLPPTGGSRLFRNGVRLWHFIVLPAAAMGLAIALSRLLDRLLPAGVDPLLVDLYYVARAIVIAVAMTSLIAWLAVRYRRQYEGKLRARADELERARHFLASIVEGTGEAVITLDRDRRVTSWNRAAEQIYGWSAAEIIGESIDRVLPPGPEAIRELADGDRRLKSGQVLRHYETERIRKDGARIVVHVTRSPLYDTDGRYVGNAGIVHDVTEIKEMETRLLEKERLAALGELAAVVAHEVKNPLAGIRGACEILGESGSSSEAHREIADELLCQVDRLNRTVEDLLLFARPKAIRPVPTDLRQVLDRVTRVLQDDPGARKVKLHRDIDPGLPTLNVDPQQVEQVFFNLLHNAFQAMEGRGEATVEFRRNGDHVDISFRDTGPGIPPQVAEKIFSPFFTTRAKGTGLGLAIVKHIVEAHRGSVRAANLPGGGAEFVVSFPVEA